MKEFNYKFYDLFNRTIKALQKLGGSGSVSEIDDFVVEELKLTEEEINVINKKETHRTISIIYQEGSCVPYYYHLH